MVEFRLPAASRPRPGKTWPTPPSATRIKRFQIYRWNLDKGGNPTLDVIPSIWMRAARWFWMR